MEEIDSFKDKEYMINYYNNSGVVQRNDGSNFPAENFVEELIFRVNWEAGRNNENSSKRVFYGEKWQDNLVIFKDLLIRKLII
jgi:hypothetical protein